MKIHEFEIYGGQTRTEHGNEWPDYLTLKIPRGVHAELIAFLSKALADKEMEESTIKLIGELKTTGEKSQMELFGPVDNAGN